MTTYIEVTPVVIFIVVYGIAGILFSLYQIIDTIRLYRKLPDDKKNLKLWFKLWFKEG